MIEDFWYPKCRNTISETIEPSGNAIRAHRYIVYMSFVYCLILCSHSKIAFACFHCARRYTKVDGHTTMSS